ncbi:hypothetical protein GH810_04615 [Acetobacterium paludosum]|uniref:DUF5610 domain-containing protein n=1 Tax=Acetobacterium paludosum TaxID=52693 RepID=A0A923KRS9_9FIRM|nr:hypothetical protein [Acetobacterium paludosum]MBC3887587.1 hypothetical protein [Acetobacterium paludosum]
MNSNSIDTSKLLTQTNQTKGITQNADAKKAVQAVEKVASVDARTDTVELGTNTETDIGTYTIDQKKLSEIKADFSKNTAAFKKMVAVMLEKQGLKVNDAIKSLSEGKDISFTVDAGTQASAQEGISEDGYWGVDKTAERIVDFAKAVSGGDKSKIETLKNAFIDGYNQAKKSFGGELPDISQKTYDKVMEGFDNWNEAE